MTDALDHAREVASRMTPGEWEDYGANGKGFVQPPSGNRGQNICEVFGPDKWHNAAGIVLATAALRVLTDEGTVEKVARVHFEARVIHGWEEGRHPPSPTWDTISEQWRADARTAARACLTAILELAQGEK